MRPKNLSTLRAMLWGAAAFIVANVVHAQVKISNSSPVFVQDYHTTVRGETILKGPGGTRSVTSEGRSQGRTLPGYSSHRSNEHIQVEGVQNPGITFEQRHYYVSQPGQQPGIVGAQPVVEGGPGSITRSSESETRSLPPLRIKVGR